MLYWLQDVICTVSAKRRTAIGGAFGEMMMAAIGGVVCFVVIKEVMDGQNTTSWL